MGEHSLPRKCRLTKTHEFRQVYRSGRRVPSDNFLLFFLSNAFGFSRVGFSSSRKVGGAVMRNRVKRRMKDVVRRLRPSISVSADVVLVAHPRAAGLSTGQMEAEINRLFREAKLIL